MAVKKIKLYVVALCMVSGAWAMQQGTLEVDLGPIAYELRNKSQTINPLIHIINVKKTRPAIVVEALAELLHKKEENYSLKKTDNGFAIVPLAVPLMCLFSFENDTHFFETREFGVKKGGKFVLTFDNDGYEIHVTHGDVTQQVDADSIANERARYARRLLNPS